MVVECVAVGFGEVEQVRVEMMRAYARPFCERLMAGIQDDGDALAALNGDEDKIRARAVADYIGCLKRMVIVKVNRPGAGLVRDTTKAQRGNRRGERTVPLPARTVETLRRHRQRQMRERLRAGPEWSETGYVFTTPTGRPIDPRNAVRWYHSMTTKAGLGKLRFHGLRHSAATLMLAQGVPLEVISATLGHSGLAVTADIYAKVGEQLQRRAADAMDVMLGDS